MNTSGARRIGWRIAAALAAVVILLGVPGLAAAADDPPSSSFVTAGPPIVRIPIVDEPTDADEGTWSPTPDSFTYQWSLDGTPIDGATERSFTPTADERGQLLGLTVTGHLAGYAPTPSQAAPQTILGQLTNTGAAISGTYAVGQIVTVSPGEWTPASPTLNYVWRSGRGGVIASGPDATSITLTDDDVSGVSLAIYATLPGYQRGVAGPFTVPPFPPDRQLPGRVVVLGTAQHHHVLTAVSDTTSWNPSDVAPYSYQWNRNGQPIPEAINSTYVVGAADVGAQVTATITTGSAGFAAASATSDPVVPTEDPGLIPTPTITGTPEIGEPLQAHTVEWSPRPTYGYQFQWYVNGVPVRDGSNEYFYPDSEAQVGGIVTVTTIGVNAAGALWSDRSRPTGPVRPGTIHPVGVQLGYLGVGVVVQPYVTGAINVNWLSYVIYRDGVAIATNAPYLLATSDWHHHITVAETESVPGMPPVTTTTRSTVVGNGNFVGRRSYSVAPTVGVSDSVDVSGVQPTPTTVSVTWRVGRNVLVSDPVIGHGMHFTIPARYAGHYIYAMYTLTGPRINTDFYWLDPVKVRYGTLPNPGVPTVTGAAFVGSMLAASHGTLQTSAGVAYKYQWFSATSALARAVPIPHATAIRYIPTSALVGHLISVRVTASKTGYTSVSALSPATAALLPAPAIRAHPAAVVPAMPNEHSHILR